MNHLLWLDLMTCSPFQNGFQIGSDLYEVSKSVKLEKESVAKYLHNLSDNNTLPMKSPAVMVATHFM